MDDSGDAPSTSGDPPATKDHRVYLVPYRWWIRAYESMDLDVDVVRGICYSATSAQTPLYGMKLMNSIFNSDLVFNLKRDDTEDWSVSVRSYALIASDLWSRAIKWYKDYSMEEERESNQSPAKEGNFEIHPLTLRVSVVRETNILTVKISKKDNSVENYKKASKIFPVDSEPVRIWDYSGQINLILMNEWNRVPQNGRQPDQEIILQIQVLAQSEPTNSKQDEQSKSTGLFYGSSVVSNGILINSNYYDILIGSSKGVGLGLTGLDNLGNTCFMNSALQCLVHTQKLADYFLGDFTKEINQQNPLGMKGELALAFGDLLRRLWSTDSSPVAPRNFKSKLARFAPQFSGFNQHDSQELLAFLLDGLHEDLNRVKTKPYIESKDADGRPDEQVAEEFWANHLARNDSIIVDIFQGQYKSTLVCPVCSKVSITFDPFMYLSLPVPSINTRTMTVTVFGTNGTDPSSYTITALKTGDLKSFTQALSSACSLSDDETLLIAEVYNNRIIRFLEEPSDSISLVRDGDRLAAYRIPKDNENALLIVFAHQRLEETNIFGRVTSRWKPFGVPLIAPITETPTGINILTRFLKITSPFRQQPGQSDSDTCPRFASEEEGDPFEFYTTDDRCIAQISKIEMSRPAIVSMLQKRLYVLVCWKERELENDDLSKLSYLPEVCKSMGIFTRRLQESVSLYKCLEAFLKEEPLGPNDMWYCPLCKMHLQASKKLDLWRLPEVLVIHLKRFTYSRFHKNKLETSVDFPVHDLDLSDYIISCGTHQPASTSSLYRLYAVSNHYGGMGSGHYTAFVHNEGENKWYDFDDRRVNPISEDNIKTSAAYVLFYRRI